MKLFVTFKFLFQLTGHTDIAQMLIHTGYNSKQKDDVGQVIKFKKSSV